MITENNVIESIKNSVNLADISPEDFESTVQFIHRQYEIVLKAKDKEIEEYRQDIAHLRKMVESSLARKPIDIYTEIIKETEKSLLTNQNVISKIAKEAEKSLLTNQNAISKIAKEAKKSQLTNQSEISKIAKEVEKSLLKHRLNPIPEIIKEAEKSLLTNQSLISKSEISKIAKEAEKSLLTDQSVISKIAKEVEKSLLTHRLNPISEMPKEVEKSLLANRNSISEIIKEIIKRESKSPLSDIPVKTVKVAEESTERLNLSDIPETVKPSQKSLLTQKISQSRTPKTTKRK
jgi:hypothetical protein